MLIEQQNIEVARKLLEKAMKDLDEKFQLLPKNHNEITLDQAIEIMKDYELVNYYRNIIVNQLKYLDNESKHDESKNFVIRTYDSWLDKIIHKIDNDTGSSTDAQIAISGSYYERMKLIRKFFDNKLKENNLAESALLEFQNTINLVRKVAAGRYHENKKMIELFSPIKDAIFAKLSVGQKDKERALTKSLITTGKFDKSATLTSTTAGPLDKSIKSQTKISKEELKKENKNLLLAMLQTTLEKLSHITESPQKKIEWLQFLQEQYKDLLSKDKKYSEKINNMKVLLEMEKLYDSKVSIVDKIKKLDELILNNSGYSKEIINKYHRYNDQLTVELANQIIDKDRELFKNVNLEEILNLNVKDPRYKKIAEFNNKISRWVAESILQADINARILAYERMINIAVVCYEQGDFNGAIAIFSGISLQAIFRLKSTIKGLSPTAREKYDFLMANLNIPQNNALLRQAIINFDGNFLVPYIGMYSTYLNTAKESNKKWFEDERAVKGMNTLVAAQIRYDEHVVEHLNSRHDLYDHLQSSENYGKEDYENSLLEVSRKYETNEAIANTVSIELLGSKGIGTQIKSLMETNKMPSAATEKYLNENTELIIKYNELIEKYKILLHKDIQVKLHDEITREPYKNIFNSLDGIDNYINVILRQILTNPTNIRAIATIAYIVDNKYKNLISQLSDDQLDQELKRILTIEKNNTAEFFKELDKVSNRYLQNAEQRKLSKQGKLSSTTSQSDKPAVAREPEIQLTQSTESSASTQQFLQELPAAYLSKLRSEITENQKRIKEIKETIDTLQQDANYDAKAAKLRAESKIYESDLEDCKNILEIEENKYISEIAAIANLPITLNVKHVMVLICNFSALLTEDYIQSVNQLEKFNPETITKLQKILSDINISSDQTMTNAISQLSFIISCLENKTSVIDYKDTLKLFLESYQTLSPKMESSRELTDYYIQLNKFINAPKVTLQVKSEPENHSPPPPASDPDLSHTSVIPEIEDLLQTEVQPQPVLDEIISDSRRSSVSSIESVMVNGESEENRAPGKHKESSSKMDIDILNSNRKELFKLIYNREFEVFNNKLNQLGFSENFKRQFIERIFDDLKNKNNNDLHAINYQNYMNQNMLRLTQSDLLASHYDLLQDYIKNVIEKNNLSSNDIGFKLPDDIAVQRFFENTLKDNLNFIHFDHNTATAAMKSYLTTIQMSDQLTSSQKLEVYEKLFSFIKANVITDDKNTDVAIYKENPDEDASILNNFLPKGRKPLRTQQIELIKLIKEAYVDIVSDAYDNKDKNKQEWNVVHNLVKRKENDIRKRSLIDFQNSNNPINISETGTRKKIDKFFSTPEILVGDKELYKEITNLKIADLNKIVDDILQAQENNDFDTAAKYIQEYLGKRKYGILTRNYREDFITIAIEKRKYVHLNKKNNLFQPSSPLLRLVKNAGPELRDAIASTEILDSHFWKGHETSKKYISDALFKGQLTLDDFINYRAKFTDKKAHELEMIQMRQTQLEEKLKEINSKVIKDIILSQIKHIRIDFLESDEFNDFLMKFITPMVAALNEKDKLDENAVNFTAFYSVFKEAKGIQHTADKNTFITKRFVDNYNKAMKHHSELMSLEKLNIEFAKINLSDYPKNIVELKQNIIDTHEEVRKYAHSELEPEKKILKAGSTKLEQHHKDFNQLKDRLIKIRNDLLGFKAQLENVKLTPQEKEMYKSLYNAESGVEAKLKLTDMYLQQLEIINKEQLQPLQKLYSPQEEHNLVSKLATTLTNFTKSKR